MHRLRIVSKTYSEVYLTDNFYAPFGFVFYLCRRHPNFRNMQQADFNGMEKSSFHCDEALYDHMYETYFCALCTYACKYVPDKHAAADIVQNVFMALWKLRAKFPSEESIRSFLYISVRNASLNQLRNSRRSRTNLRTFLSEHIEREVIPDDEADEAVITAETERQLLRLIEELPRECRKVLKHSLRRLSLIHI